MLFVFVVTDWLFSGAVSTNIPISWTDKFIPHVLIAVNLPDNTRVSENVTIDLNSPHSLTLVSSDIDSSQGFRRVEVPSSNPQRSFQFESPLPIRTRSGEVMINSLDLSPNSSFARAANSFMITQTSLVISPNFENIICGNFSLIPSGYGNGTWSFRNGLFPRQNIFLETAVNTISLPEQEYDAFLEEILDIETIRVYPSESSEMMIADCDMDQLDEILPVFQYNIQGVNGTLVYINLSARQYLLPPGRNGSCTISIRIAEDTRSLHIGSVVFRKYSIWFDNQFERIGVCEHSG